MDMDIENMRRRNGSGVGQEIEDCCMLISEAKNLPCRIVDTAESHIRGRKTQI